MNDEKPMVTYPEVSSAFLKLACATRDVLSDLQGQFEMTQFTIDLFEEIYTDLLELIDLASSKQPNQNFFDINTFFGANCYSLKNTVQIFNPEYVIDRSALQAVLAQFRKYDKIHYIGLL